MSNNLIDTLKREIGRLVQIKKTERLWHIPVLASLCSGLPLLLGYYIGRLDYGILACLGGLVILYMPTTSLEDRMITLVLCAFGFIVSFTVGICFSFNLYLSAVVLGLYAFGVNWITTNFHLHAPGNFFFIMIASMASCMPFNLVNIPEKIGLIAFGTIFACIFAFLYSLYVTSRKQHKVQLLPIPVPKRKFLNLTESMTIGIFAFVSLLVARLLNLDNPYWIPIPCLAIMQGASITQVWQRSIHRMSGTFIGVGLTWLLLQVKMTSLNICLSILILQFIIEMLVVRHYALAVIFITPMTVFLTEIGKPGIVDPDQLIATRVLDIVIGSCIGILGGWVLHNQYLHQKAARPLRKTRIAILKRKN